MLGDEERMKGTTKTKLAKAFGALRPKSRNSGKAPSSASSVAPLQDPATTPSRPSTSSSQVPQTEKISTDNDRSASRYEAAAKSLKDVVENIPRNWEGFVPPVAGNAIANSLQLQEELDKILNAWNVSSENQGLWASGKRLLKQVYIATSPFAKHFLLVAKDAAQVSVTFMVQCCSFDLDSCSQSIRLGGWRLDAIHNGQFI